MRHRATGAAPPGGHDFLIRPLPQLLSPATMLTDRPLHVLVVDDDPVARMTVRAAVERVGHMCSVAVDGADGLAAFRRERPSVVIADWSMPGLDGTQLTRRIRERDGDGYTYVIVLTADADEQAALATMHAGADDLVIKPLGGPALERRLIAARRVIDLHDRLRADALSDALTGVANRRAMDEELHVMALRATRYGHELAVVLLDLDQFKAYNDSAGHPAGDQLLKRVAGALQDALRRSDRIFRYGGEEFMALLPGQQGDGALATAERLCAVIAGLALPHPAGGPVTVSAGAAALVPGESPQRLLARADAALYDAKRTGRNRARLAAPPVFDSDLA